MSDTLEALINLLRNHDPVTLTDCVACFGCEEVFTDGGGHYQHLVELVAAEFLVIPRSEITGTEYGWREAPGSRAIFPFKRREGAIRAARQEGCGEAIERPALPWSVIPLPEDGPR